MLVAPVRLGHWSARGKPSTRTNSPRGALREVAPDSHPSPDETPGSLKMSPLKSASNDPVRGSPRETSEDLGAAAASEAFPVTSGADESTSNDEPAKGSAAPL